MEIWPINTCQSPFMRLIHRIVHTQARSQSTPPIIKFELSREAAQHNKTVFESFDNSLHDILESSTSIMKYGSEFKPTSILFPLLHSHKNWDHFKQILEKGSTFPLNTIDEETRKEDFEAALKYGNHKSATAQPDILLAHVTKEIQRGWMIPILPDHAKLLEKATISPMGIVSQLTINERGEVIPSNRITHDLSFPGAASKQSINSRTRLDELIPCNYGHMLARCIHHIVQLRMKFTNSPIVIQKVDFKSAYRRVHLNASTATQCMSQVRLRDGQQMILLPLRLTFGGSACPAEWCVVSEMVTDLANRILDHKQWDTRTIFPSLAFEVPPTTLYPANTDFAKARPLSVELIIAEDEVGRVDVYVDDICTIGVLENEEQEQKLRFAALLAMECIGTPITSNGATSIIVRDNIVSLDKLKAEAGLSEVKILLGWELDTRRLTVRLTQEKYVTWTNQLRGIISANGRTSKKVLESVIGRLNHTASIIPIARHFLSRLYYSNSKASTHKPVFLNGNSVKDLYLWLKILDIAKDGISMNLLTYRFPDVVYWSDACNFGIGGYSSRGNAWKWRIPQELQNRAHINLLEFLAEMICIWIDILNGNLHPDDCVLCFGDSTTAMGWLHRSNFRQQDEAIEHYNIKTTVARHLAQLVLNYRIKLYSQWLQGQRNGLADALSRDDSTMPDELLTLDLSSRFHTQVPHNFKICPLPPEIVSFISNLLRQLPKQPPQHQDTKTSVTEHGQNGRNSSTPSACQMTRSYCPLPSTTDPRYLPSSLNLSEKPNHTVTNQEEFHLWLKGLSEIPSACWHRPSWRTMFQTRDSTTQEHQQSASDVY
jgi:hypothetical protein